MSKRLFALLLAAALVLSMGAAQMPAGQTADTEQAEQGADVSAQAPDAADTAGDDAPANEPAGDAENDAPADETGEAGGDDTPVDETGEPGGDDTPVDETGEAGENDAPVDEDSGDGGETAPAAISSAPSSDEPQTTADGVVKVTLVDDEGYVTWVWDSNDSYRKDHGGSLPGSYELKQGDKLRLEASSCALDVVGGHVIYEYYHVNDATGELSVEYQVVPDGSGDMTVTTRANDHAPTPIKIEYTDEENKIKDKDNYVLPGRSFSVELEEGYTISAEDGVSSVGTYKNGDGNESYMVYVSEDATSVKVIVTAAKASATLSATIPDAVESNDIYKMSEGLKRTYVGHGGTMENGKGWFLLKNGYEVGSGVKGGFVTYKLVAYDEETRSIHAYYRVDATEDEVIVPIVEVRPYRWVGVQAYDAPEDTCDIGTELVSGWDTRSKFAKADSEIFLPALDELTATIRSVYELAAVSGCTLRWEKGADGKNTYRIIPDEAGNTSVKLRVIDAGEQPTEVKVGIDAGADVQTDEAAEGLLQDAMDVFVAKGGVPAGMSSETADALKAALEAADAFTVPELSAVLRVKEADTAAVQGADAVYEIEIVLSVNGTEVGSLTELAQPISIGLPVPQQLSGRIVYLVRSHDGEQERLASTVQDGVIRFATDRFSEFAIMSSNDLADAVIDPIPDQTWTGSAVTPKVRVTITGPNGEETLEEDVDYELVYRDNVKAGTAAVTIVGIGAFADTSAEATFRIVGAKADAAASDGTAPATGDETPLALYAGLLALSVSGLAAVLLRRKKRRQGI